MSYNRTPNTVLAGRGLKQAPAQSGVTPPGVVTVTVDADISTTESLGLVQVGDGLTITPEGVLSATAAPGSCGAILVDSNYTVVAGDYYVGVNSITATTITLPCNFEDCTEIIVKAEMGAPMGNRKITIITDGDCTIDGSSTYVIEVPYQSVRLLSRGSDWHII